MKSEGRLSAQGLSLMKGTRSAPSKGDTMTAMYDRKPGFDPISRFEELANEVEELSHIVQIMAQGTENRAHGKALHALAKHLERVAEEGLVVAREGSKSAPRKIELPSASSAREKAGT